jgi:asparagine synthase (glutamine-hydrolysing)
LLHSGRIQETLAKPLSSVSPMYERMGMELAVGLNTWLNEYDVSLEL